MSLVRFPVAPRKKRLRNPESLFLRGAKWHSCFSHPLSPPPQGGGSRRAPVVLVAESLFLRGAKALVFLQLCGILIVICYSSGRKEPFASFLGTTVMCFKSFPLQLSAIVCMCMAVVKFGGHVTPSWGAVWAIRRGFCGRLQGRGHGTYLQRSF